MSSRRTRACPTCGLALPARALCSCEQRAAMTPEQYARWCREDDAAFALEALLDRVVPLSAPDPVAELDAAELARAVAAARRPPQRVVAAAVLATRRNAA